MAREQRTEFTDLLNSIRKTNGLTYRELAEQLQLPEDYVSNLVRGLCNPNAEAVRRIIECFATCDEDKKYIYDCAAHTMGVIPPYIEKFLVDNPDVMQIVIEEMQRRQTEFGGR